MNLLRTTALNHSVVDPIVPIKCLWQQRWISTVSSGSGIKWMSTVSDGSGIRLMSTVSGLNLQKQKF